MSIVGAVLGEDKDAALNAGLSGFNAVLQGLGETEWAVSLDKELVIVPYNVIPAEGISVTLESFIAAIDDLKTDPLQGKRLGTLDKHHSKASGVKKKAGLHHSVHRN